MPDHRIPKPQLRGLLAKRTKRIVPTAVFLALSSLFIFRMTYIRNRKEAYRKWYAENDIEEQFKRIAARGVFDSVPVKR